jgi:hypothetical protein
LNDAPSVKECNPKLVEIHQHFEVLFRTYRKQTASHWEKRELVSIINDLAFNPIPLYCTGETTWSQAIIILIEGIAENWANQVQQY